MANGGEDHYLLMAHDERVANMGLEPLRTPHFVSSYSNGNIETFHHSYVRCMFQEANEGYQSGHYRGGIEHFLISTLSPCPCYQT